MVAFGRLEKTEGYTSLEAYREKHTSAKKRKKKGISIG